MAVALTHPQSELLPALASEVEAYLSKRISQHISAENLADAVRYAALGPGKRIRPALVLLCCEAVGGEHAAALDAAAAIELIHAFSLVHDDLPAMDNDDLRRGRPTLHKHTNEAMAILAGDIMVSLAFGIVAHADVDAEIRVQVAIELAQATNDMIVGQVYDTLGGMNSTLSPRQTLELIHRHKTGALIRAACRMGGICAAADNHQLDRLTRYGECMGLMFQIVDDLLDVTQSSEHLGKAAGKDIDAGKLTYPGVLGVEVSRTEVVRLRDQAHDALKAFGSAAQPLRDLCDVLAVRTK
jgi:geranylgeranyl diphosphate synthase type II